MLHFHRHFILVFLLFLYWRLGSVFVFFWFQLCVRQIAFFLLFSLHRQENVNWYAVLQSWIHTSLFSFQYNIMWNRWSRSSQKCHIVQEIENGWNTLRLQFLLHYTSRTNKMEKRRKFICVLGNVSFVDIGVGEKLYY